MLFDSTVPQTMTEAFKVFQDQETQARKLAAEKMIDFYHGRQLDDLKADLAAYTGNMDQLKPVCLNVVKKITNRLAPGLHEIGSPDH